MGIEHLNIELRSSLSAAIFSPLPGPATPLYPVLPLPPPKVAYHQPVVQQHDSVDFKALRPSTDWHWHQGWPHTLTAGTRVPYV